MSGLNQRPAKASDLVTGLEGSNPSLTAIHIMITENENYLLVKDKYPHIAKSIVLCWGSGELTLYLNSLFHDTRDGHRQGFPKDIAKALWHLLDLHTKEFPETNKLSSRNDPFHTNWDR